MMRSILAGVALLAALPAAATTVADASNDFLSTYAGPHNGDLDIVAASATLVGDAVQLSSVQNGAVGTTAGSLFVWGINRGAGTPRLSFGTPSVGAGVLFDAVAVFFADGSARVVSFPAMGPPTVTLLGGATIAGNAIGGLVPLSLLPSRGFATADYTYNVWSRNFDGANATIADFAPDDSSFTASVPEPATWALMLGGFGLVGAAARRGRSAPAVA